MHGFRQLLRSRNFRLLWGAGGFSAIGDQFDFVAFPWLVLLLTGDPVAVGTVIAIGNAPTVFFMLLGGGLVDRFSPRLIMQSSNLLRLILGAVLAALILTGRIDLWLIYPLALLKGLADALYYPAQGALLPRVVSQDQLRPANAMVHTTFELSGIVGPALAGALIALFANNAGPAPDTLTTLTGIRPAADTAALTGLAIVFAAISLVFLFSALLLTALRLPPPALDAAAAAEPGAETETAGILRSIIQGIRFVRADTAMFTLFLLIAGVELLVEGPVIVGIPILANSKMPQGALALGIIASAHAAGALTGSGLAGLLSPPQRRLGLLIVALFTISGLLIMPFGFLTSMLLAAAIALIIGVSGGYFDVLLTTWIQLRTPQRMLGRVMSLLMVATVGLGPASSLISGFLIKLSLEWVFVGSGALIILLALITALRPEIRAMQMPAPPPEQPDN